MNDIKIDYITKEKLITAIENNSLWLNDTAAFPKSKANWIVRNTRINNKDYCAIVATEKNNIVGLMHLLPDIIQLDINSSKKVYWILHWWMSDKYVGNILSTYMFREALRITNNEIIIKSYAENAETFYKKMPFKVISTRNRYTIFFSLDSSILFGRYRFLNYFKIPIKTLDNISAKILRYLNSKKLKKNVRHLKYEYVNEINDTTWNFIAPLCKTDLVIKTKDYLNWQIDKKQHTLTPCYNKFPYKVEELGVVGISNNISIYNLVIMEKKEIIGFISFLINYNELNIKYFLVKNQEDYNLCVDALIENLIKLKRNFIFTDDSKLAENIKKRYKTIFTHKITKKGLAHNDLKIDYEYFKLQNQDGHFY